MALAIYKRGQGYYTRLCSAIAAVATVGLGCFQLYRKLDVIVFENATTKIMVQSLLPLAIFAGFAFVIYWLVNRPIVADFMIAAEGELKKVTWSTRKELTASTLVVIGVMVVMAAVLFLVDIVLQYFFMWINLIPGGGA